MPTRPRQQDGAPSLLDISDSKPSSRASDGAQPDSSTTEALPIPNKTSEKGVQHPPSSSSLPHIPHSVCSSCYNIQLHEYWFDHPHVSCMCYESSCCCPFGYEGYLKTQSLLLDWSSVKVPKRSLKSQLLHQGCTPIDFASLEDPNLVAQCSDILARVKFEKQNTLEDWKSAVNCHNTTT